MIQLLFLVIAALGLLAALGTVLARNLVHAALFLVAFFFIVACQFVLLEAEFLAAIQVLVYIGAVAILLMFGIMLTRNIQGDDTTIARPGLEDPGVVAGLGVFGCWSSGSTTQVGPGGRSAVVATDARPALEPSPASDGRRGRGPAAAINNMAQGRRRRDDDPLRRRRSRSPACS